MKEKRKNLLLVKRKAVYGEIRKGGCNSCVAAGDCHGKDGIGWKEQSSCQPQVVPEEHLQEESNTLPVTSADYCVKGSSWFVVSLPFLFGHMPNGCNLLSVTKACVSYSHF